MRVCAAYYGTGAASTRHAIEVVHELAADGALHSLLWSGLPVVALLSDATGNEF